MMENKESILQLLYSDNINNWKLVNEMIGFDSLFDVFYDELNDDNIKESYFGLINGYASGDFIDAAEYSNWNRDGIHTSVRYTGLYELSLFRMKVQSYDNDGEYYYEFEFNDEHYALNIKGDLNTCRIPIYNILKEVICN